MWQPFAKHKFAKILIRSYQQRIRLKALPRDIPVTDGRVRFRNVENLMAIRPQQFDYLPVDILVGDEPQLAIFSATG